MGIGGTARLDLLSEEGDRGSLLLKYEARLASGDCGGRGGTSREVGTGGGAVRIGSEVSTPDVSSSDSEPGPGESGAAAGGGGGIGRDSVTGARGVAPPLGGCGTGRESAINQQGS